MNHADVNPDIKKVETALKALIKALDYPEHEIENITILHTGIVRVATRDHAVRGVMVTPFDREEPQAPAAVETVAEAPVAPTPAGITVTKTPARAGAK